MAAVSVQSRSKSIKSEQYTASSLEDLTAQVSRANRGISVHRLRFTDPETKKVITDAQLASTSKPVPVTVKDLGPQISWRGVYIIEYLGPILIHYVVYNYLAGSPEQYRLIYQLNIAHYLKREFETLFVHRFSNSTMPLFNLFKNSGYYWTLGGAVSSSYFGLGNLSIPALDAYKQYALYAWIFSQFFNFITHTQLRLLGDKSVRVGKPRETPRGGFFELFIAPNYTFEIYGWLAVFFLNPNLFTLTFWFVGTVQMYFWAVKKGSKFNLKTKRYFLIPFVI